MQNVPKVHHLKMVFKENFLRLKVKQYIFKSEYFKSVNFLILGKATSVHLTGRLGQGVYKFLENSFSVFHVNVRSLNKNFEKLIEFLSIMKNGFGAIAISENWCNDDKILHNFSRLYNKQP